MKLNPRVSFLVEHLNLPEATGIPNAVWEDFQLRFINSDKLLDISTKSRQIGWSWVAAADAVANSLLYPNSPHVFVSISQDEATEKIRYANQIIGALDKSVRPTHFPIENRTEIEFPNGSRLISHPCKPPRGKGRLVVYLDEFAHYPIAGEIFTAALPATTRGGRVRIGSTPLGARGKFWEIYAERIRPYPGFYRRYLPWWVTFGLCVDVEKAKQEAPGLPTHERVAQFGTMRLKEIFDNMVLENFQQEFECSWIDESVSWITWDEIQRNQLDAQSEALLYRQVDLKPTDDLTDLDIALEFLRNQQQNGGVEWELSGGMDVGRKKNLSEIALLGSVHEGHMPFRLGVSLDRLEFKTQEEVVKRIITRLNVKNFRIDQNGLGMQLAENLSNEYPEVVTPAIFTAGNKQIWAVALKLAFQNSEIPIPLDKDMSYQIHSVRKKSTASNATIFDSDDPKHHADKFWALALAVDAVTNGEGFAVEYGAFPV